jgi:hypothetical protein
LQTPNQPLTRRWTNRFVRRANKKIEIKALALLVGRIGGNDFKGNCSAFTGHNQAISPYKARRLAMMLVGPCGLLEQKQV